MKMRNYDEIKKEVLDFFRKEQFSKASEVLVNEILSSYHIYTTKEDKASEMWIYKEGIYIPQGKSEVKEILRKIMGEYFSSLLLSQVLGKIEADTFINTEEFFRTNIIEEIPVKNGVLNVLTCELNEFSPEKIFFTKLNVEYNKEATCPKIDKFLSEVLRDGEDKKVFYEIAGFGLFKEYFIEKAIMCVGNGRNGKSKALELLKRLYGPENCKNIPLSSMNQDDAIVSELFGKLMNLAGDISSRSLKDTGMFKSLVGRDLISAKRKYLKTISFTNYAKMIFACNELPRVYDYSDGFWERWVLLEFPYKFTTQEEINKSTEEERKILKLMDVSIIDKITTDEELSGLLNQALDGLKRLKEKGSFSYTVGTSEIKNMWVRKADSFMAFCMDMLDSDFEGLISKKDLRKEYNKYCKKHKVMGVSDKSIKATLQDNYGVVEEYKKLQDSDSQEWFWVGLKFKDSGLGEKTEKQKAKEFFKKKPNDSHSTEECGFPLYILKELTSEGILFEPRPGIWRHLG